MTPCSGDRRVRDYPSVAKCPTVAFFLPFSIFLVWGAFMRGPLPDKTTGGKIKIKAGKLAANHIFTLIAGGISGHRVPSFHAVAVPRQEGEEESGIFSGKICHLEVAPRRKMPV